MRLSVLTLLLCSAMSFADEYYVSYGLGIGNSADNSTAQVKTMNAGHRYYFLPGFYWGNKAGFWIDNSAGPNRKGSGYISSSLGMKVQVEYIELRSGWGLAAVSNTDSYLGGHFPQFNGEIYIGIRDVVGHGIGLQYEHISSSGIHLPNKGRDFLMLQLSMKLPLFGE